MSRTVLQLRQAASRRARDLWTGTLTSEAALGAGAVVDTKRNEATNFFVNGYLHVGADATAEDHRIDASTTGGSLSLTSVLAGTMAVGTAYEIHRLWSVPDYNAFIADAILAAGAEAVLANVDDTSLSVTANANKPGGFEDEYAVPSGLKYIYEVSVYDGVGMYRPIPLREIRVLPGTATRTLRFSQWAVAQFGAAGRAIRILGQGVGSVPSLADTTAVYIDPDFVVAYVELQALIPIAGGTGARAQFAANRVRNLTPLVEQRKIEAAGQFRPLPGSLVVPD